MIALRCNDMPHRQTGTRSLPRLSAAVGAPGPALKTKRPPVAMDAAAVRSFCDATGASEAQATARLQAFGGNVEAAVNSFFGARSPLQPSGALRPLAHSCGAAEDGADGGEDAEEVYEAAAAQPVVRCARATVPQRCPKSLTRRRTAALGRLAASCVRRRGCCGAACAPRRSRRQRALACGPGRLRQQR
jgi:hypothetical protein